MKSEAPRVILFGGPTLYGLPPSTLTNLPLLQQPPVVRGDLDALINAVDHPGEIVIADGIYSPGNPLEEAEVIRAFTRGWKLWGVSSTGALLAAQMKTPGLRGFGAVFRHFLLNPQFGRDEIALLHSPEPPYAPFSEPLIHLRLLLEHLVFERTLPASAAEKITVEFERSPLSERTLDSLNEKLVRHGALSESRARFAVSRIGRFRAKGEDLFRFLQLRFRGHGQVPNPKDFSILHPVSLS